jgi:GNAT superfamily N-acetyltransferase
MEHLSIQVEPWAPFREEAAPLLPRHWEELALEKDKVPLDPNWRRYAELDAVGAISLVTMRQSGRLVGYSIMFVMPGLHYMGCLEARMDIFWVAPEVRGRMGGLRLFRAHERELRRRGVKRIYAGSKLHKDSSRLFVALGYTPIETWFSKWISED